MESEGDPGTAHVADPIPRDFEHDGTAFGIYVYLTAIVASYFDSRRAYEEIVSYYN